MAAPAALMATLAACRFQSQRDSDSFAFRRSRSSPTERRCRQAGSSVGAMACMGSAPSRAVGRSSSSRAVPRNAFPALTARSACLPSRSSMPARTPSTTVPAPYPVVHARHHQVAYGWRCSRRSSMKRRRSAVPASQRARSVASAARARDGTPPARTRPVIAPKMIRFAAILARPSATEQESSRCR
jgi:hypothetical protein